jgi:hypothetical protein
MRKENEQQKSEGHGGKTLMDSTAKISVFESFMMLLCEKLSFYMMFLSSG